MKALPLAEKFFFLRPDELVYLHLRGNVQRFSIKSLRKLSNCFAVSFNEVTDREVAALYRGALISCPVVTEELREGEFLYEQIIGLSVVSTAGEEIGTVMDIFETGAHDVYVVRDGEKEYLIPAVREFVRDIRLAEKKIVVNEMKGLVD